MPKTSPTKDRFDDLPADRGRVGAHRAENPRIRGGLVLLWSVIATVVLVALGVFGTMLATGRISLAPSPEPTVSGVPTVEPVIDTSFSVLVLNATPQSGLAAATRDTVIAAGWPADSVIDSDATTDDFPEPERPVMTTSWSRGMRTSMFLRLCSRAPRTRMWSRGMAVADSVGLFR